MNRTPRLLQLPAFLWLATGICQAEDNASAKDKLLFTPEAYRAHVRYLASDELTGRLPGTPGGRAGGDYIARQFKELGLKPAGVSGSYFQPFPVRRLKNLHEERAAFEITGLKRQWRIRQDWIPLPYSKPGKIEGPLAFAGYGIAAPDHGYNDYAGFDATGKVLLILRYEPRGTDPGDGVGDDRASPHGLFVKKAQVAAEHGALALLVVNPPKRDPDTDELYPWHIWNTQRSYALPLVHISRELTGAILQQAGLPDLKTLQERLDQDRQALSTDLDGISVSIDTGVAYVEGRNVIGRLEGDGSTDEMIVVGAHYDHDGEVPGPDGQLEIHNGADDNASGCAGMLELARVFVAGPRPRRHILFMAFDAEERGLLGSKHFVAHPTIDIKTVRAMINLDMIGRLKLDKFTIWGTTSAEEFPQLVRGVADKVGLSYRAPATDSMKFGASDHFSFYRKDIPVLFPFTGVHKHYNTPEDDWQRIDADGATRVLQMMHAVVSELANTETGPTFVARKEERELREKLGQDGAADLDHEDVDEVDEPADRQRSRGGLRVRLGIMPDFASEEGAGLRVEAVMDDGPAAKCGMKDGDLITRIAGDTVTDIYTYMDALRKHEPGDEVEVLLKRDGKPMMLKVKLEASRRPTRPEDQ